MSEEEKHSIKVINKRTKRLFEELEIEKEDMLDEQRIAYLMQEIRANKTVLNLVETQNKMIELMAELIFNHRNSFEWWENGVDIDNLEQQIEYFRNKAKESE